MMWERFHFQSCASGQRKQGNECLHVAETSSPLITLRVCVLMSHILGRNRVVSLNSKTHMTAIYDARLIYGSGWISRVFICGGALTLKVENKLTPKSRGLGPYFWSYCRLFNVDLPRPCHVGSRPFQLIGLRCPRYKNNPTSAPGF